MDNDDRQVEPQQPSTFGSFLGCTIVCTVAILALTGLVLSVKALIWSLNL